MHRFYIPAESWNLDSLKLDADEAHHALDVLRLKQGDRAVVFNGRGSEATVEIAATNKNTVDLRRIHDAKSSPLPCKITLAQAVPKGKNMDLIVQKATELGAAAIIPLISERTVVQVEEEDASKKREKWQAVAIEAAKQCGQNWLPEIHAPQSPKQFFQANPRYDLMLIASLQPGALHFKKVLEEYAAAGKGKPSSALILVGPEGDFTPAEIGLAKSGGCRPITLGPIVLRTETAAIYCLSILGYELLS
ncbi:MAG TPA: 16S rRNA (uracil(1498)-N(3))-methyltransferase [Chthoniobacteraceae bacterium]|nr:16S rRNA (uracil(1498)-N(3))-methyltransferase [Chthoniobacteraceae bacterium]